jgi:Endosomal/lysosomal potassium channel TMEM175
VKRLSDRVRKLPRHEDDEAAKESIGRILALSDGVFAIAITLLILRSQCRIPLTRIVFVWFFAEEYEQPG